MFSLFGSPFSPDPDNVEEILQVVVAPEWDRLIPSYSRCKVRDGPEKAGQGAVRQCQGKPDGPSTALIPFSLRPVVCGEGLYPVTLSYSSATPNISLPSKISPCSTYKGLLEVSIVPWITQPENIINFPPVMVQLPHSVWSMLAPVFFIIPSASICSLQRCKSFPNTSCRSPHQHRPHSL